MNHAITRPSQADGLKVNRPRSMNVVYSLALNRERAGEPRQ